MIATIWLAFDRLLDDWFAHLLEAGDQRADQVMGELLAPAADVRAAQVMGEVLDGPSPPEPAQNGQ